MNKGAIGVIGGMGPEASSYMFNTLVEMAARNFGAKSGDEFPEIVVDSVPVPDFFSDVKNYEKAKEMLIDRVKKLNSLSLNCLSIACNTAHLLLPDLQRETNTPFISMIDAVVQNVQRDEVNIVGLLGSPMTLETKLYQTPLESLGVEVIIPSEDEIIEIENIIKNVIDGTASLKDTDILIKIISSLKTQGIKAIILGCTELPLIFPKMSKEKVYNSVRILSQALLKKYYSQ